MEETKVIYYIDDEDTPYMMKIMESPSKVTLKDFKAQLNRPYKKFYFRSTDDDIGWVVAIFLAFYVTVRVGGKLWM